MLKDLDVAKAKQMINQMANRAEMTVYALVVLCFSTGVFVGMGSSGEVHWVDLLSVTAIMFVVILAARLLVLFVCLLRQL